MESFLPEVSFQGILISRKDTFEEFASCWEGIEDPRYGNAAVYRFHELRMVDVCCVLVAEVKDPFYAAGGNSNAQVGTTTAYSACWRYFAILMPEMLCGCSFSLQNKMALGQGSWQPGLDATGENTR